MNNQLSVYYDKSCILCRTEIEGLVEIDFNQFLKIIDCSAFDFNDAEFIQEGITREQMLGSLHIKNAEGSWFKGVDAFHVLYMAVGLPTVANLWGGTYTKPITKRLYPLIARNRYWLSKIGIPWMLEKILKIYAKRANRNSQKCKDGLCKLDQQNNSKE